MTRAKDAGECVRPNCKRAVDNYGYCKRHKRHHVAVGYVDAGLFYERVALLRSRGYSLESLAAATGVSRPALAVRDVPRVRAETARKVFALPVPRLWADNSKALVPAVGTARRIKALRAIGYGRSEIAAALGMCHKQAISQLATRETCVSADTANRVSDLYQRWHMTPGPSSRAKAHASRQGWAPPLAWDDIDDPTEQSSVGVYVALPFPDRYAELRDLGVRDHQRMAERLGLSADAFERQYFRHNLHKAS